MSLKPSEFKALYSANSFRLAVADKTRQLRKTYPSKLGIRYIYKKRRIHPQGLRNISYQREIRLCLYLTQLPSEMTSRYTSLSRLICFQNLLQLCWDSLDVIMSLSSIITLSISVTVNHMTCNCKFNLWNFKVDIFTLWIDNIKWQNRLASVRVTD